MYSYIDYDYIIRRVWQNKIKKCREIKLQKSAGEAVHVEHIERYPRLHKNQKHYVMRVFSIKQNNILYKRLSEDILVRKINI